jgi:hypothetical protein
MEDLQRVALLRHVVVTVIVPSLHAGEPVRLKVFANLAADQRCQG